ncbi:hypothetical protein FPV67DRAFT_1358715, partial [Lyophyllum atratum]
PPTADDLLFSLMTPRDLIRYGQISRSHYHAMQAYAKRAFDIVGVLSRYFTAAEIPVFRHWQYRLGMIITGSTSLQFFARVEYDQSDLDVIVQHANAMDVGVFLNEAGYDFDPSDKQRTTYAASLADRDIKGSGMAYNTKSVVAVYDFVHRDRGTKVQVITTDCAPVQVVLEFYSTVVMTFITHAAAYCLYPVSTFENKEAIATIDDVFYPADTFKKYNERGFAKKTSVAPGDAQNQNHELGVGPRFVGDKHCFVVPI